MPELYEQLGLTRWEYEKIREIQGREPTHVELAVFSLMWSEHCGYKHSKPLLKRFPTTGPHVLQGPGENAGVVDIGGGVAVAMKVESHNHPSAVEPYQGAATGVGGIIRDIFAMGARPICGLDSLRFGEIQPLPGASGGAALAGGGPAGGGPAGEASLNRQRYLFEHVVAGVGGYGNCMGIPTVAGEIYFEDPYAGNCLVNAMTVGLVNHDEIIRSKAAGRFLIGVWDVHYHETYAWDPGWLTVNSSGSTLALTNNFGAPGILPGIGGRYANVIRWDSPVWSGFSLTANYARPTDTAPINKSDGDIRDGKKNRVWNIAARYESGGLSVGYSYLSDKDINQVSTTLSAGTGGFAGIAVPQYTAVWKVTSNRLGARYKFANGLGIGAWWDSSRASARSSIAFGNGNVRVKRTVWSIPLTYTTGNHHVYGSWSKAGDWNGSAGGVSFRDLGSFGTNGQSLNNNTGAKFIAVGYAYKLSQRTNVGVSYQKITNESFAAYDLFANSVGMAEGNIGADPRTFAVNLRHNF